MYRFEILWYKNTNRVGYSYMYQQTTFNVKEKMRFIQAGYIYMICTVKNSIVYVYLYINLTLKF